MRNIEIKNRWTGAVLFACEVADDDGRPMRTALQRAISAGANLTNANLTNADLAGANLAGANLTGANLTNANLTNADLANANLAYANLTNANLTNANLTNANLTNADLAGADLAGANLAWANLANADLADANLAYANLAYAILTNANLADAYLAGANLTGANLAWANLAGANLTGANLADARGMDPEAPRTDPPEPYARLAGRDAQQRRAQRYREANPHVPVVDALDAKILQAITAGSCTLDMSRWHGGDGYGADANEHACGTTHCRAGFAVHFAGPAGYALEREHGPEVAGAMIYRASTGRVPHFYAGNERALRDIERCAAEAIAGSSETSK